MKNTKKLILSALMISTLFSCALKKDLDDMHDSTVNMDKQMNEMVKDVKQTNETSNGMYQLLKQSDGARARFDALKDLVSSEYMGSKKKFAAAYFFAFEYQTWNKFKDKYWDAMKFREDQILCAIEELANDLDQFMVGDKPETAYTLNNKMQSLFALSVTVHRINHATKGIIAGTGLEPINLLEVIKEGLRKIEPYNNGEITELKPWEREVQKYADKFVYLLQARYLFTPVAALSFITPVGYKQKMNDSKIAAKYWNMFKAWVTKSDMKNESWELDTTVFNKVQLELAREIVVDGTMKIGKFLKEIGHFSPIEDDTIKIYQNLVKNIPKAEKDKELTPMEKDLVELAKSASDIIKFNSSN